MQYQMVDLRGVVIIGLVAQIVEDPCFGIIAKCPLQVKRHLLLSPGLGFREFVMCGVLPFVSFLADHRSAFTS